MNLNRTHLNGNPLKSMKNSVKKTQNGAVMIVALMLLLVMTVLAVSGIGNSSLEQRMAGNYYHAATSFQAAEYGLRVAEGWLINQVDITSPWETWFQTNASNNGLYTTQDLASPNTTEVCQGGINCRFDPNDESAWCTGAGCVLPKGFVTLGDTLQGTALSTIDLPVARQPQFIIEHVGTVGEQTTIQFGVPQLPAPQTGFRITVIGWGQEGVSQYVLQSHVILPL
ncbi:MAG: pilus assembly protein [Candidatus Thiodiazotropha sp. (ex Gloverina cf. vestifex)]|nr:pilus assembly protein [Candidatus Thiodiazotropha sp. (ex Gloverina cf. vestifex)]